MYINKQILAVLILFPLLAIAQDFPKSAIVKPNGKEADVIVHFESDRMSLIPKNGDKDKDVSKEFLYSEIKDGEYSYSKAPRYKTAVFVAWPFLFTKGKKHWFTIVGEKESAVLHLDKKNYKAILAAFESRTGKKVEIAGEEK